MNERILEVATACLSSPLVSPPFPCLPHSSSSSSYPRLPPSSPLLFPALPPPLPPNQALEHFRQSSTRISTASSLFNQGVCLINLGKKEDAVGVLQQCLETDPTMWKAAQALGSVQMQMGDFETGYVCTREGSSRSSSSRGS